MISPALMLPSEDQEGRALVERLFLGASGNVVVNMGIVLHRLARNLGPGEFEDLDGLAARIEQREMRPEFLEGRDRFIAVYVYRALRGHPGYRKLAQSVRRFPPVIDSRGRILGPPPRARTPDRLVGLPISPAPSAARSGCFTPPMTGRWSRAMSWSPAPPTRAEHRCCSTLRPSCWLIGGVLQHGALVAREFGKPCVVGIEGVTGRLKDGEMVEVDGAAGTMRRLQADP